MQIVLNGQTHELEADLTVADLLSREQLAGKRVAVELNGDILPRSRHGEQRLQPGDRIEIVHAIGGG
ncbi:sulfur carrier protein ThiS [Permianibacter sp. IMCC34836]|uniref:sulfur carrier protein ThiS n=1 Tax=Permianibacter fluminis TaxID=2738515 RepID=UPI001553129C|nr:sulfur carrier protein ThiS [Permianibacter fluminis]NQD35742.1 sulfur carrier protein ThiS [Permianibacter fluminis]